MFGISLREIFRVEGMNLSVAVWVGFIALFGIATDAGVVQATYLDQAFAERQPNNRSEVRGVCIEAGMRRLRPCLMTIATTVLALLPVITARGRGADVMLPMALPIVGGMFALLLTLVTVPLLYGWAAERRLARSN